MILLKKKKKERKLISPKFENQYAGKTCKTWFKIDLEVLTRKRKKMFPR